MFRERARHFVNSVTTLEAIHAASSLLDSENDQEAIARLEDLERYVWAHSGISTNTQSET